MPPPPTVIPLGSFTLSDQADIVTLSCSSSLDIVLPEALAGTCDPASIAAKVKQGDLWIHHLDSCLLEVSFEINGTPIKSDYTAPRWGQTLAGCAIWRRLGIQLEPRPLPISPEAEPEPASSVVQFLKQHEVTWDTASFVNVESLARLKVVRCTFNYRLGDEEVPITTRAVKRARGRGRAIIRSQEKRKKKCLDVVEARSRAGQHGQWNDQTSTASGTDSDDASQQPGSGSFVGGDGGTDEFTPGVINNNRERVAGKRMRPTRTSRCARVLGDLLILENKPSTVSTLMEAAAHMLTTGRRLPPAKLVSRLKSPSLAGIAPVVFNNEYARDISARASLIPIISSALGVLKHAQSPSLRRKFAKLCQPGGQGPSAGPQDTGPELSCIEKRLWRLTITGVTAKLPGPRKQGRTQHVSGQMSVSNPIDSLLVPDSSATPVNGLDIEFLPSELQSNQSSQSTIATISSATSLSQHSFVAHTSSTGVIRDHNTEGLIGDQYMDRDVESEFLPPWQELLPLPTIDAVGDGTRRGTEFYPDDDDVPHTGFVESSPPRNGADSNLCDHNDLIEEFHPGQLGEYTERLPSWAWDDGDDYMGYYEDMEGLYPQKEEFYPWLDLVEGSGS